MGTCKSISNKNNKNSLLNIIQQKSDIINDHEHNKFYNQIQNKNEKIEFLIQLKDFKGKKLSKTNLYIEFEFNDQLIIKSDIVFDTNHPIWKINQEFQYNVLVENIHTQKAKLILKDEYDNVLTTIIMPIKEIALGPIHHEYNINDKQTKFKGKIAFNLIMKQKMNAKIQTTNVVVNLNEDMKQYFYKFQLKMLGPRQSKKSNYSYEFVNQKQNKRQLFKIDDIEEHTGDLQQKLEIYNSKINMESKLKKLKQFELQQQEILKEKQQQEHIKEKILIQQEELQKASKKNSLQQQQKQVQKLSNDNEQLNINRQLLLNMKRELRWNLSEKESGSCALEAEVLSNELGQISLQFRLYGTNEQQERGLEEELKTVSLGMVGEIYVGMNKLIGQKHQQTQLTHLNQKLWQSGRCVGSVQLDIHLTLSFYFQQMICGLRTEKGLSKGPVLYFQHNSKQVRAGLVQEMISLQKTAQGLESTVFKLQREYN